MKFINENAAAITVLLLAVGMAVGATVWVVTEVNDVRNDLSDTERRLTEKINENAAGIAEINERLDRIEERMDRMDQRFEERMDRADQRFEERMDRTDQRFEEHMDRTDQRFETMLNALSSHTHADDGSPTFTRPTTQENPADAENENQAAQR